ncbi:MAG: sterol desaturase family protein [Alphaproteobacteria bacterium]|nr:sterol desaturase family protein [Alphaproteobacteria bacterium]
MRRALSYIWWPLLFGLAVTATYAGIVVDHAIIVFNVTYILLAIAIALLERAMPHETAWLENDGQVVPDIAHTLLNKGVAQVIIVTFAFMGLAEYVASSEGGLWPVQWPLALQVVLGLVLAEIGLYWKHRLAHEWPPLWRFHAVHHSVTRLWFLNTGRFHFVDTLSGLAVGMPLILFLGAPKDVMIMVSAITAFIGILTHANVEMRCGILNYVFNTPELHRWHHSKVLAEGNRNYGENLMLFDQLFGTFFHSPRRPPADIGIQHPMPATFVEQLKVPFSRVPL